MSLATQALLVDAFINALRRIREVLTKLLEQLFTSPKSWRDADADRFVERALPMVEGAQRAAASLTDDFLSRIIADQTGTPYRPRGVDLNKVTGSAVRNGVPLEQVYRRPFHETWTSLGEDRRRAEKVDRIENALREAGEQIPQRLSERGREVTRPNDKPLTEAVGRGERRATMLGLTDIELAVTHTVRERLADEPRYRYYRRVLTGAENCGLCVVASTQRYRTGDLMPIHPNCDCVVAPIIGDADPGRIINTQRVAADATPSGRNNQGVSIFTEDNLVDLGPLLKPVHEAIEREFGFSALDARQIDYRKVITVHEHGELGPVLTVSRHKFTGQEYDPETGRRRTKRSQARPPTLRPAASEAEKAQQIEAEIDALKPVFATLQARRAAGENVETPYAYQRDRLARLRKQLAELTAGASR